MDKTTMESKRMLHHDEDIAELMHAAIAEKAFPGGVVLCKRWQENEERKANLRLLEEGWLKVKEERAKKRDKVMDVVDKERQAAEARRLLWLMERSEEWVPEENLDLAIAAAILEPTEL